MIDELNEISDCERATLIRLAERVERSTAAEHFVYRESEADDVWRRAEYDLSVASDDKRDHLERRLTLIHEAHDVLGEEDASRAAALLRAAAALG